MYEDIRQLYDYRPTTLVAVPMWRVFQQEGNKYNRQYDRCDTRVYGIRCGNNNNTIQPCNNGNKVDIILRYSGLIKCVDKLPI